MNLLTGNLDGDAGELSSTVMATASPQQEHLWVVDRLHGLSSAYNLALALQFSQPINLPVLARALDALVERHEPLRTVLVEIDGRLQQGICPARPVALAQLSTTASHLAQAMQAFALSPYDLGAGPLFRACVFHIEDGAQTLVLGFHHAVVDGMSITVILRELTHFYEAALDGHKAQLPALVARFQDHAAWQSSPEQYGLRAGARDYWAKRLKGLAGTLDLPRLPSQSAPSNDGKFISLKLGPELASKMETFARDRGATRFMVWLAGYAALLSRFASSDDVPIGVPVANRERPETQGVVGFMVDTVVLRTDLSGAPGFGALVERVRDACRDDLKHKDVPFGEILGLLKLDRSIATTPVFQAAFNFLRLPVLKEQSGDIEVVAKIVELPVARFDLAMELTSIDGDVAGRLEYRLGMFDPAVAQAMANAFGVLLSAAVDAPEQPIESLPLMAQGALSVRTVEAGDAAESAISTLHGLFLARARAQPEAVAIIDVDRTTTYRELDRRSASLAAQLRNAGVSSQVPVGICLPRSERLAVTLLAVLRAGGVVLALDPDHPPERLAFMLSDSGAKVLIAPERPAWLLDDEHIELLLPDGFADLPAPVEYPSISDLAYLIYTSGSTGKPKGVMGLHRGAVNRIEWMQRAFPFEPGEVCCQKTTVTFVDFIAEFFGPLAAGVPLVIVPHATARDPVLLANTLQVHGVTRLVLVPSLLRAMLEALPDPAQSLRTLRLCISSGEAISVALASRFTTALPGCQLLNLYGSSEVSADATWHLVRKSELRTVPIGQAIPGNRVLLLDALGQELPVGIPGEIHVGGVGVALGYVGQPGLTAERFIPDHSSHTGERIFRTGDLGRWLEDGVLEYLGRMDLQVKIGGVRVEPGEVQVVLGACPGVIEAVVVALPQFSGDLALVAYVVAHEVADAGEWRDYLLKRLPAALVPVTFIKIDRIPLNPSGKVDFSALPRIVHLPERRAEAHTPAISTQPANLSQEELQICQIWADVLGAVDIRPDTDFFAHGGNSLLAIRAVSRLNRLFGIKLAVAALFEASTPQKIAELVRCSLPVAIQTTHQPQPMKPALRPSRLPLSFNQMQLWLAEQTQGAGSYNVPNAYRLEGALNVSALESALSRLAERHEALRTRLVPMDGEPIQVIDPPGGFRLMHQDLSELDHNAARHRIEDSARQPFALHAEAPWRVTLFKLEPTAWMLLIALHHSACDGATGSVLIRELSDDYNAILGGRRIAIQPSPWQPADLALWQKSCFDRGEWAGQIKTICQSLEDAPVLLNLPGRQHDMALPTGLAGRVSVTVPEELLTSLRGTARDAHATLHMALLAAWGIVLASYCGQEDILVGTPAAARDMPELENSVGFLVNMLAIRLDMRGHPTFADLVARVRQRVLDALAYQHIPLSLVVDALKPRRAPGRAPLVQAMFVMHQARSWDLVLPGATVSSIPMETMLARYDLALVATEYDERIELTLEYAQDTVDHDVATHMAETLLTLIRVATANAQTTLSTLDFLGVPERELLGRNERGRVDVGPAQELLHQVMQRHAIETPDAPAIWHKQICTTYGQLDSLSTQVAIHLRKQGVQSGCRVGLVADRCPGTVVAMLAILKAGAAYVPIDPSYPDQRIDSMLTDAAVTLVISDRSLPAWNSAPLLVLDPLNGLPLSVHGANELAAWDEFVQQPSVNADSFVACVIFTSGSTGRPKGVIVTHGALTRLGHSLARRYGTGSEDRVLQIAALGFDVAAADFALAFSAGAAICLSAREDLLPGRSLQETIARCGATHAQIPASILAASPLVPSRHLRVVAIGGETCPPDVVKRWASGRRLFFSYGPTEATVMATLIEYAQDIHASCIGEPFAGSNVYLLNRFGKRVPVGAIGELTIGGTGVSLGYFGDPARTAELFVPDPYNTIAGARMYRSGDLARWSADGRLEFLGRMGRQVKLRGFRIEPEEIEACLAVVPGVSRALVAVRRGNQTADASDGPSSDDLCAFVVSRAGVVVEVAELQQFAKANLPPHMVPTHWKVLNALPLTPHGKVDFSALLMGVPDQHHASAVVEKTANLSKLQSEIGKVWFKSIGRDHIDLDENFFDAGGHSLKLVQVHAALEAAYSLKFPISDLFAYPTIRTLAQKLANSLSPSATLVDPPIASGIQANEPVAIIGMACRFPGALDVQSFWKLLAEGREGLRRADDTDKAAWPDTQVPSWGVVPDVDMFDADFFGLSPRDAEQLDPQHRLMLECAWQAMENAGYDPGRAGGMVGVFAGTGANTYLHRVLHPDGSLPAGAAGYHAMTANDKDFLPTQIAYRLDLRGPAIAVQSACSTSLVAVAMAMQALRSGQCRMALAGGVSIQFPQADGYAYEPGMILSPDGRCRPFAADAAGTVPSGGAGFVLLKPLSMAIADCDNILAVINGAAITNDGASKVGYTAPSVEGQARAIAGALANAGVTADQIDYVEAHGTGTELGDPVEVAALARIFSGRERPLLLGSVKSNIGHADAAAGVAGLIKTVLSLQHQVLPPSLHANSLNPHINFAAGPFEVVNRTRDWSRTETPRMAGVSAFGIGGTNAHLVLAESPPVTQLAVVDEPQLVLCSARSPAALSQLRLTLASHLAAHPELSLADVAGTLRQGRAAFAYRSAVVASCTADAAIHLKAYDRPAIKTSPSPKLALMFPGQGSQFPRMGEALYLTDQVYRDTFDQCAVMLLPQLGADLRKLLYGQQHEAADAAALKRTSLTQPALFAVSYAMAARWLALGLEPTAFLGHSVGEYVAATLAGVFRLEDALAVVASRGHLVESLEAGGMLALSLTQDECLQTVAGTGCKNISIAAMNGVRQTVVAGPLPDIESLAFQLASQRVSFVRLDTSHAFHSSMLEPVLPAFAKLLEGIELNVPAQPFLSNVSGTWITDQQATDPAYWVSQLRAPVLFSSNLTALELDGYNVLLESGPGQVLCKLARPASQQFSTLPTLPQKTDLAYLPGATSIPGEAALDALGHLWALGVNVKLAPAEGQWRRTPLPTYPFERKRFWPDANHEQVNFASSSLRVSSAMKPEKLRDLDTWIYQPVWTEAITGTASTQPDSSWLLFVDRGGYGLKLASLLKALGKSVTVVQSGNSFEKLSATHFLLPPSDVTSYVSLLDAQGELPARIVHLWGLDSYDNHTDALDAGFHSLVALSRAWGGLAGVSAAQLDVVMSGVADVTGEELLSPEKAVALGAVKVIPLEMPQLRSRAIDMDPFSLSPERLLIELAIVDDAPLTALRGRRRWQQDFQPANLQTNGDIRLRHQGVCLITGGFGHMGATIARGLARSHAARLVLVGRTEPSSVSDVNLQNAYLRELEGYGADVMVVHADVSDVAAMTGLMSAVRERFGELNGVVHTAGVVDRAGVIHRRSRADSEAVMAAKVSGTRVMDHLLDDQQPLDFMLLCSTLGSVLHHAKFGQVAYAGANEFLDLYAAQRSARTNQPTFTINWDDWVGGGMTVEALRRNGKALLGDEEALTADEGMAIFRRVLQSSHTRLVVSVHDLQTMRQRVLASAAHLAPEVQMQVALGAYNRGDTNDDFANVHDAIARNWQKVLGVTVLGESSHFFELGGHSLLAMQVLSFVRERLGVEIGLAVLFEAPQLGAFCAKVEALRAQTSKSVLQVDVSHVDHEEFVL